MRICFIDTVATDYRADTPYISPMGGTQAAACYLAEALAAIGHEVSLWTKTSQPGRARGVDCANLYSLPSTQRIDFDVVVLMSAVGRGAVDWLRATFPARTRFVLWIQHADDQPGPQALSEPEVAGLWHAIALVSGWQARRYIDSFGIPADRVRIMRNAASPRFAGLFGPSGEDGSDILAAKAGAPVLAYSSAPYRGLNLAAAIFPRVRRRFPDAELMVFSGPRAGEREAMEADPLFRALLGMEGVTHLGSLPQPELADALKRASVLLYPNSFAETSCIAVIEALAAGCRVVTSNLGALPETTAGFGVLLEPFGPTHGMKDVERYIERFADEVCAQIAFLRESPAAGRLLRLQVDHARLNRWDLRAWEWDHLFRHLHGER